MQSADLMIFQIAADSTIAHAVTWIRLRLVFRVGCPHDAVASWLSRVLPLPPGHAAARALVAVKMETVSFFVAHASAPRRRKVRSVVPMPRVGMPTTSTGLSE